MLKKIQLKTSYSHNQCKLMTRNWRWFWFSEIHTEIFLLFFNEKCDIERLTRKNKYKKKVEEYKRIQLIKSFR